jgi:hypothetical protein
VGGGNQAAGQLIHNHLRRRDARFGSTSCEPLGAACNDCSGGARFGGGPGSLGNR